MKHCIDCHWFQPHPDETTEKRSIEYAKCTNPKLMPPPDEDPVSGEITQKYRYCEALRKDYGGRIYHFFFRTECGTRARFFERAV